MGLPYGTYPRLILSWLTTEAVKTKQPELELGSSLSGFMSELGLIPAGGRWGTIHRLRNQMKRLFSASVSCTYEDDTQDSGIGFRIAKEYHLWRDPKQPDQAALWRSAVTLSRDFFDEVVKNPVPIDMRALKALKRSPMALDIYCWMTYRMSYLKRPSEIPWGALQAQFGADYKRDAHGLRNFRQAFKRHLKNVLVVYPEARTEIGKIGVILRPSKPHIPLLGE